MHRTDALAEADRLMTVCNSCRYCEGLCAVFPAMEMRRDFQDGDLNYLANLCHSCGACYYDCQFSPPHEFAVNVPKVLAEVRNQSYEQYAWPRAFRGVFARHGLIAALLVALSVALFLIGFVAWNAPAALFTAHLTDENFYALMPHNAMALLFGTVFLFAVFALCMGARNFWRDIGEPAATLAQPAALGRAAHDAGTLRYLDGGGEGCMNEDEAPTDRRRIYHHLTFYGFMLCFAATSVATLYHYVFGRVAPYPWWDVPVILGTLGGIGLLIGPAALLAAKLRRDEALQDGSRFGMDTAFLAMLFLTGLTGLMLLLLRTTPAMGVLLAVHLGFVLALFLTLPYGKFVHGIYRYLALVRYAKESKALASGTASAGA